jgi:hypothetical protein
MDDVWKALTALIALSAFLVGLAQWRMAREKLRLDLFERRYTIFSAAKTYLEFTFRTGRVEDQNDYEFRKETRDALFLFRSGVDTYLQRITEKLARLKWIRERTFVGPGYLNLGDDDDEPAAPLDEAERNALLAEEQRIHNWVGDQLTEGGLQEAFEPYLQFRDQLRWVTPVFVGLAIVATAAISYLWFRGKHVAASTQQATTAAQACLPVCEQAPFQVQQVPTPGHEAPPLQGPAQKPKEQAPPAEPVQTEQTPPK